MLLESDVFFWFWVEQNDGEGKKQKTSGGVEEQVCDGKAETGGRLDGKKQLLEPPRDYIHVRARRGQATDSHSLAERVLDYNSPYNSTPPPTPLFKS